MKPSVLSFGAAAAVLASSLQGSSQAFSFGPSSVRTPPRSLPSGSLPHSSWYRQSILRRATIDLEAPTTPPLNDDESSSTNSNPNLLGRPIPYNELTVGILKERYPGENRVSQTPDSVALLIKGGLNVVVETGGTSGNGTSRVCRALAEQAPV